MNVREQKNDECSRHTAHRLNERQTSRPGIRVSFLWVGSSLPKSQKGKNEVAKA